MTCQRCSKHTNLFIMSMYNEQEICMDCKKEETQRSDYAQALEMDEDEIRNGNFNFKGMGLK